MSADAEALFAEHRQRLFGYLYRACGHSETARDLTQDVFVRVSQSTVPVGTRPEIQAWLFKIARNLVIDHHRRQTRTLDTGQLSSHPRAAATQETAVALNEALATLGDVDRDVFLMREVAGLSYDEIATACEVTPASVRSRLHRTRLELRRLLAAPIATTRALAQTFSGRRHSGNTP